MSPKNPRWFGRVALALITLTAACDLDLVDSGGSPDVEIVLVSTLGVDSGFFVGETRQYVAVGIDGNGVLAGARAARWSSTDTSVATVTSSGLIRAKKAGQVTVRAETDRHSAFVILQVLRVRCADERPTGNLAWDTPTPGVIPLDACRMDSERAVGWNLLVSGTSPVALEVAAPSVFSRVTLRDSTFAAVRSDDGADWPAGSRRRWTIAPGRYTAWAVSSSPDDIAPFSLRARRIEPCEQRSAAMPLALAVRHSLTLDDNSCILRNGAAAERFALPLAESSLVAVHVASSAFRPGIHLPEGAGSLMRQEGSLTDDSTFFRSFLVGDAGVAEFFAGASYGSAKLSDFTVTALVLSLCAETTSAGMLALDSVVAGSITVADCVTGSREYALTDEWLFDVATETRVILTATKPSGVQLQVLVMNAANQKVVDGWGEFGDLQLRSPVVVLTPGRNRIRLFSWSLEELPYTFVVTRAP